MDDHRDTTPPDDPDGDSDGDPDADLNVDSDGDPGLLADLAPDPIPARDPLTARQRRFIAEYAVDCNATAAYRRAGYNPAHAHVSGPRLLGHPLIAAAIQDAMDARSVTVALTAENVLREIRHQIFFDVADLVAPDGRLLPLHEIPPETRRAIQDIEVQEYLGDDPNPITARTRAPASPHAFPPAPRADSPADPLGADDDLLAEEPAPAPRARVCRIRMANRIQALALALDHLHLRHPREVGGGSALADLIKAAHANHAAIAALRAKGYLPLDVEANP